MPQFAARPAAFSYSGPSTVTMSASYGPVLTTWPSAPFEHDIVQPYQQPSGIPCVKRLSQTHDAMFFVSGWLPYWKFFTGRRS